MLSPFTQDELALFERSDFLRHAAATNSELVRTLRETSAADRSQPVTNNLGEGNRWLLEALNRFIAGGPSDADRRTAQQLSHKVGAALDAAQRP